MVKENLPKMVLTNESPHKLLFEFNSTLWGYVTLLISGILGVATYFALLKVGLSNVIPFIFGFFCLLFLYSSIYSFKLRRSLEINGADHVVEYKESSLYKGKKWRKDFQSFKSIKAFRPLSTATSSGGRRAINWSIQLISNDDEIFDIGYSQFGAANRKKAEELIHRIATIMGINHEVVD